MRGEREGRERRVRGEKRERRERVVKGKRYTP